MFKEEMVSVIVPCYNQAQYLEECIQSVIDQTYQNIEIIIVNDGSNDNTEEVARELERKYSQRVYVLTQENHGLSQTRNNGIKKASGKYILPLDADDKLDKTMISKCMSAMINNDADIVYVEFQHFGRSSTIFHRKVFSQVHILYENQPTATSLYKKEVWNTVGGYKANMNIGFEDWEFWINAYKHDFKFQCLHEVLFHYRIKEESMVTHAYAHNDYLKAKIVMNHPELYPIERVEDSIKRIRIEEELSGYYFYYENDLVQNKESLIEFIDKYLKSNSLKEKQTLKFLDQRIGLYSLETFKNDISIKELCNNLNLDNILFYASMRYEVPLLQTCHFSWSKASGMVKAYGTIFPFIYNAKRKNVKLQTVAAKRLLQYQKQISGIKHEVLEKQTEILNKKSNLVSIIIPCYNHANYLQESVESAISQTYDNIEIIIVNDGSGDNTQEVAEGLQKKYPEKIKIVSQENMGLSQARNNGIEKASGTYIVPLDADDLLDKQMVEKCLIMRNIHNADIVYTGYKRFGTMEGTNKWKPFSQNDILYLAVCSAVALFSKKVWHKIGGYKKNMEGGYEDWEFWINAYKHGYKFQHLAEILFAYRKKEVSMFTLAYENDKYLKAKITLNHPELYTEYAVEVAIKLIKEKEDLPDLFFYYLKEIEMDEKSMISLIENHLTHNSIQNQQIINLPKKNQKVGLCSLDVIVSFEQIELLTQDMDVDFIIFYAPVRYGISRFNNSDFAWKKDKGIVKAKGTFFPFLLKSIREDSKLQLIAYKRLHRYKVKFFTKAQADRKKEQILIKKQEKDIANKEKLIKEKDFFIQNQWSIIDKKSQIIMDQEKVIDSLLGAINNVKGHTILKSPKQKYKAYIDMLNIYKKIRPS